MYMGIDQFGSAFHALGKHPRKELLDRLGRSHASKMYVDGDDGALHCGYVIGGHWITLYKVAPAVRNDGRWEAVL